LQYEFNGQWHNARVINHDQRIWVYDSQGESEHHYQKNNFSQDEEVGGSLKAPMNGTLIQLDVTVGQSVSSGDPLMIMEAMKMEHAITAPHDGVVKSITFAVGDLVGGGDILIELD